MKKAILIYILMFAFIYANAQSYTITPNNTVLTNASNFGIGGVPVSVGVQTGRNGTIEFRRGGAVTAGIQNNNSPKQLRIGVFNGVGNDTYKDIVIDSATHFVGINTLSANPPLARFHVFDGNSTVIPHSRTKIFIEDNGTSYLSFGTPDANESGILFGRPSFGATSGGIIYTAARAMQLRTSTNDTRIEISEPGNVGIGTTGAGAKLVINGDLALLGKTNSTTTGTINNFDRAGNSVIRFDGVGNIILNGITGGIDGLILHIYTTFNVTQLSLGNQNGGSLPENQIITGGSVLLFNDGAISLIYDGTSQKWRVLDFQQ